MIISPVDEVENIYWPKRVTGKALKAEAVVVIPGGGRNDIMIVKLANGGFVSSWDISKFAYLPGQYPWMDSTIKALVKLGAITPEAAKQHMAACEAQDERRAAEYRADSFLSLSKETGIPLSKAQQSYVEKHGKKHRI